MLSTEEIKHRAVRMAVTTGAMLNVDFIWMLQAFEDHDACFGRGAGCPKLDCRWRGSCIALAGFDKERPAGMAAPDIARRPLHKAG